MKGKAVVVTYVSMETPDDLKRFVGTILLKHLDWSATRLEVNMLWRYGNRQTYTT